MADQEHLVDILKQGVETWNRWSQEHPDIRLALSQANLGDNLFKADLSFADLREANLSGAYLSRAYLREANLSRADLKGADLREAYLKGADLSRANFFKAFLSGTDLSGADLREANLSRANLSRANLSGANLSGADLREANLSRADLREANLSGANFFKAFLSGANFFKANLSGANLSRADLSEANLNGTDLSRADLSGAHLRGANFFKASLSGTDLRGANLREANLNGADFSGANLSGANLSGATLVRTNLTRATLTQCSIYGISAWNVELEGAIQNSLVITPDDEPTITVDNLKIAQFIYLLLNNKEIRDVINTITTKVVLILGRFTPERIAVLDELREALRKQDYLPILFDFEKPSSRNFTETVRMLAHLARFIIADLTDPSSIPQELYAIVPTLAIPVQPVLLEGKKEYAMSIDLLSTYHWMLPIHFYKEQADLLATLKEDVIEPAEHKAQELEKR